MAYIEEHDKHKSLHGISWILLEVHKRVLVDNTSYHLYAEEGLQIPLVQEM